MDNIFTVKHGIKFGIGLAIGTSLVKFVDHRLAKELNTYVRMLKDRAPKDV